MNKAYLISTATALALGYSAGFATDGFIARAAIPTSHTEMVTKCLNGGGGAESTLEGFLLNQMCDEVVNDFGVAVEDCTIEKFREAGVIIGWNSGDTQWCVRSPIQFAGSWVEGEPE